MGLRWGINRSGVIFPSFPPLTFLFFSSLHDNIFTPNNLSILYFWSLGVGERGPDGKAKQEGRSSIRVTHRVTWRACQVADSWVPPQRFRCSRSAARPETPFLTSSRVILRPPVHGPLRSPVPGDETVRKWDQRHQDQVLWKHRWFLSLSLSLCQFTCLHDFA